MKFLKSVLPLLLFVSIIACEERIEWEVDSDQVRLVVEGRVTNEFMHHEVRLTTSSDYFDSRSPVQITGAQLTVTDGTSVFEYEELGDGLYRSIEAFAGEVGKTYTLEITIGPPLSIAGTYTASSTMMETMQMDTLYNLHELEEGFFGEEEDSVYQLLFEGEELEGEGDFYLFEIYRNGEIYTDSIDEVLLMSDEFIDGFNFEEFIIYSDTDLEAGDSISVRLYAIEEAYYNFLNGLFSELEGSDPFGFSGPPANFVGNVSGGSLGYFYASSFHSASTILEE